MAPGTAAVVVVAHAHFASIGVQDVGAVAGAVHPALHDLLGRDNTARKTALVYLLKLGAGWIIGMGLCISLLAGLFADHIYSMSSLFDLLMSKLTLLGSGGAIWLLAAGGMLCTKNTAVSTKSLLRLILI